MRENTPMHRPCWFYLILVLCLATGCTAFDADYNGSTSRVLFGKEFTITMPALEQPAHPHIDDPRVACFLEHSQDSTGKNVYRFKATQVGETDIRIPRTSGSEFVMTIIVVLGGSKDP
jgi:hypothetical protein